MSTIPDSIQATQAEAGIQGIGGRSGGRRDGYIATSATTTVTVRGTAYTPQGTNQQRSVKSTSANDTATGTGARTMRITYYDASCAGPFTEDITLNGTSAVNTVSTTIALIEKMEVLTVGSGGGNAGIITIFTTTAGGGSAWGTIAAGDNQTYWAHHYVATGMTCYITELDVSGKNIAGIATLNSLDPTNTAIAQKNLDISFGYGSTALLKRFETPIPVRGPAIIFLNSKPDASTASTTHGAFSYFEQAT